MNEERQQQIARNQAQRGMAFVQEIDKAVMNGIPADVHLNQLFRQHRELGSRDRRFISQLVFSYFRWKGWLTSYSLEQACATAYQLDAHEAHPAIQTLLGAQIFQPMGHLGLSEKAKKIGQSPDTLFPAWLKPALFHPDDHFLPIIEAFQQRPPTWLRANHGQTQKVREALTAAPICHPVLSQALGLDVSLNLDEIRKKIGCCFEVQDIASQCVGLACNPKPGESWWDVCAGAGGKSLHLADLMKGHGEILATDVRASALEELQRRALKAGVKIIHPKLASDFHLRGARRPRPQNHNSSWAGHPCPASFLFDGVLVDAPCSGIGTWSRNPDARWRMSEKTITERAAIQLDILSRAASSLKPGGKLIYAVCTITRAETVDVISAFLSSHKNFELMPILHPLDNTSTDGNIWIWPWDGPCDGMYIAHLERR